MSARRFGPGMSVLRAAAVLALAVAAIAGQSPTNAVAGQDPASGWHASWRTAPQPPLASGPSHDGLTGQTVRMIIHPTVGGRAVRVQLSNLYGTTPLQVGRVAVAQQDTGPAAVARTQRVVTFGPSPSLTIPAGDQAVSDAVPLEVRAGRNLLVSLYLPGATGPTTWHNKAQATSYISSPGDWTTEPGGSPYQGITPSWFFLDGLDVLARPLAGTIVAFGDSITDGAYSTIDADHTYVDWLAHRLGDYAVLNEGIGGNRILTDTPGGGQSALHRIQRDAFEQPGVTDVILLEGVNDIGANATAQQLIDGMTQIVDRAHARCLRIIGGTVTPFKNSVYDTDEHERTREAVNQWIRTSGKFDGVADFDKALRDSADPLVIDPRYHTVGDLHPNDAGYKAMAAAVTLPRPGSGPSCTHD